MQDSGTTRPYSSQEYLQKLRQDRLNRQANPVSQAITPPATEPTAPPQSSEPVAPSADATPTQPTMAPPSAYATPAEPVSPQPEANPETRPLTAEEIEAERQRRSAFQESELFPGQFVPIPEEVILEWTAPNRPFKKRNRQFYTTVALITGLISLILFFAGQFLPIAVVIAVAFLSYVLSSVPPETVRNKVTTWGVRTDDKLYYWEELGRFWFEEKFGEKLLQVETGNFPGRLTLLLATTTEDDLKKILQEVLLNEKPKDTFYDKAAKWLQDKIPLDND